MVNPFCASSKDYHHPTAHKKYGYKIRWHRNEKAAIIKLRKQGYTINQLAQFTGRSTSQIHQVIKTAIERLCVAHRDYRRGLPDQMRKLVSATRTKTFEAQFWGGWEAFILGETDRPP